MRHRWMPHKGQSLVEFALIAPLLFALMFILVELGIVFSIYIGLTNSAREAARAGSVYQYLQPDPTNPATPSVGTVDTQRAAAMDQALLGTLNPIISIGSINDLNPTSGSRYSYQPATPTLNSYRYGDKVTVRLSYNHNLFFNLFGSGSIRLNANSEMRLEPGGF
jgi:Flp pilus assembly protein TadG